MPDRAFEPFTEEQLADLAQAAADATDAPDPTKWTAEEITEMWETARPQRGSLAKAYFQKRGLDLDLVGPNEMRSCEHASKPGAAMFPALIFPGTLADGTVSRIQAIRFNKGTFERRGKTDGKLTNGTGAAPVRFAARPDYVGTDLLIAEGPEDALTLRQVIGAESWAMLSISTLGKAADDNDLAGRKVYVFCDRGSESKTTELVAAYRRDGVDAWYVPPPEGFKDPNETLVAGRPELIVEAMEQASAPEVEASEAGFIPKNSLPLPSGFKEGRTCVYRTVEKEGQDQDVWLCSPIRVLALPRGEDGKGWGRLVEIRDDDGRWHRWAVPAEMFAGDGLQLRAECMRLGLNMDTSPAGKTAFSNLLQRWRPKPRAITTEKLGWASEACRAFVLGSGQSIGDENVVYQAENAAKSAAAMFGKGTLRQWQKKVAALCKDNPLAIVSVSLALSGPLLEMLREDGGGVHLRGASSSGKSTLLKAAVSVWGSNEFLHTWRSTSNGLEGTAVICNSTLLALDEMAEVSGRDAGQTVYMLANGQGKTRSDRTGNARPQARWRTAILSSGEISLADKMAEDGKVKRAGQDVRLIDIQADSRDAGAFDCLHGKPDGSAFSKALTLAAADYHGTAGPAFVKYLIVSKDEMEDEARTIATAFVKAAKKSYAKGCDGQVDRVLFRIGMIAAAGEMATLAGITNWIEGTAREACHVVGRMWMDGRGGAGSTEDREAIERVSGFITRHGESRFKDLEDTSSFPKTVRDLAGWKKDGFYYVTTDAWKEIHKGFDPIRAAKAVHAAKFLNKTETKGLQSRAPSTHARCYAISEDIFKIPDETEGGEDNV